MKNLRCLARAAVHMPDSSLPLTATTWDTTNDSLICAFGPTETQAFIELRRAGTFASQARCNSASIAVWDVQCPNPDLTCDKILDLHYFADTAVVCLVLAGGDIVIVREQPLSGEELLEIVGSVDAGVAAAGWSPDDELLTLVTGVGTVVFMSRDFETISEARFDMDDVRLSKHVDVGWGKKETQFRGKKARALKDPTMPDRIDTGVLNSTDDGQMKVSWRGDGQYVAVNAIQDLDEGKRRIIRVYSREGVLDAVTEPVDHLEGPLSWRPSGNIIAGVRKVDADGEVVFFERNGLRHGEYKLRLSSEDQAGWGKVRDLHWNVDSTILAITFEDRVQLWTMGNYHYYLKQEFRMSLEGTRITGLVWHPEKALRLAIHGDSETSILEFAFTVTKGSTISPSDHGTVAVIDGKRLKITPLRAANVPPPMALHELRLGSNAIDVAIDSTRRTVSALTFDGVTTWSYDPSAKQDFQPEISSILQWRPDLGSPQQIALLSGSPIVLSYSEEYHMTQLWTQSSDGQGWKELHVECPSILSINTGIDGDSLCVEQRDGSVLVLDPGTTGLTRNLTKFPKPCAYLEVTQVGHEEIAFGLTTSGALFANQRQLITNCTSFLVTTHHLVFTTTEHLLQFVHITSVDELEVPPNEPEIDERCRRIERGARLVTAMPSACSVVLQMPRGNLETIYPRALVLAGIRKSIEEKKYKKAFLACRNHRVDMNMLHDHMPDQFMAQIELFLDQLKRVEYIDLFLSQLRDEDVSKTLYKDTVPKHEQRPATNGSTNGEVENPRASGEGELTVSSKSNRICDALLEVLRFRQSTNLQNIITANVCKSPPDLESGLAVVSRLRTNKSEDVAEKAAEHICFLADVNQLYETALGMYDLEMALLIAQQSQKDPKEYVPYLQGLQQLPLSRRQFRIDDDLGRHRKALGSLHNLDAFDEVLRYAEKHELYSAAIELYKYKQDQLAALTKSYADYFSRRNRFEEAGIAYESLNDYASAMPMYSQALRWRECLFCAIMIPLPQRELKDIAQSLAEGLTESKEYQSAATIYQDYLSNVAEAARQLCKAYLFADAMRLVSVKQLPDLLDSVIDPGLAEGFTSITELLADCKAQAVAQVPRLRELREKKERDPLAFYAGDAAAGEAGADFPDNISLAPTDASTSGGTFMTRYTGATTGTLGTNASRKTSKNRRKEERKRARGKKGSVYEEEYLVNSIGRLIDRLNVTAEEARRLVEGLVRRGMRERAVAVDRAMEEVLIICERVKGEVFEVQPENRVKQADVTKDGHNKATGADAVFHDMLEGGGRREAPVIKKYERFSLIA